MHHDPQPIAKRARGYEAVRMEIPDARTSNEVQVRDTPIHLMTRYCGVQVNRFMTDSLREGKDCFNETSARTS